MTIDKIKNETVMIAGVITSLVIIAASFGLISSEQQASIVGGVGTLVALITAVIARSNVFSKKTVAELVLNAAEKATADAVSNAPAPVAQLLNTYVEPQLAHVDAFQLSKTSSKDSAMTDTLPGDQLPSEPMVQDAPVAEPSGATTPEVVAPPTPEAAPVTASPKKVTMTLPMLITVAGETMDEVLQIIKDLPGVQLN